MRIVGGKFHDYYDSVRQFGFDTSLTYVRTESQIDGCGDYYRSYTHTSGKKKFDGTCGAVGFCGKFYPYIVMRAKGDYCPEDSKRLGTAIYTPDIEVWCYTEAQWEEFLESYPPHANAQGHSDRFIISRKGPVDVYSRPHEFFAAKEDLEPFFVAKAPVLIPTVDSYGRNPTTVINGRLRNYHFMRLFGPYEAFQEISMFLGGVLPNAGNTMVVLSDVDKRDKHGFDDRSFKRDSPGKKTKRRA